MIATQEQTQIKAKKIVRTAPESDPPPFFALPNVKTPKPPPPPVRPPIARTPAPMPRMEPPPQPVPLPELAAKVVPTCNSPKGWIREQIIAMLPQLPWRFHSRDVLALWPKEDLRRRFNPGSSINTALRQMSAEGWFNVANPLGRRRGSLLIYEQARKLQRKPEPDAPPESMIPRQRAPKERYSTEPVYDANAEWTGEPRETSPAVVGIPPVCPPLYAQPRIPRKAPPLLQRDIERAQRILDATCTHLGITRDDIASTSRHPLVLTARALCVRMFRQHVQASFPQCAALLRMPTHSTMVHADKTARFGLKHNSVILYGACGTVCTYRSAYAEIAAAAGIVCDASKSAA